MLNTYDVNGAKLFHPQGQISFVFINPEDMFFIDL